MSVLLKCLFLNFRIKNRVNLETYVIAESIVKSAVRHNIQLYKYNGTSKKNRSVYSSESTAFPCTGILSVNERLSSVPVFISLSNGFNYVSGILWAYERIGKQSSNSSDD